MNISASVDGAVAPETIVENMVEKVDERPFTTEEQVKKYFRDIPVLVDIAQCESRFRHTGKSGSIIRGEINPYDIGVILDQLGIAVRTGHHCTQPLMDKFGIKGTVRVSLAFYNTKEEIDELAEGVIKAKQMLK